MRDITVSVAVLTIPSGFIWSSMRMVTIMGRAIAEYWKTKKADRLHK